MKQINNRLAFKIQYEDAMDMDHAIYTEHGSYIYVLLRQDDLEYFYELVDDVNTNNYE